MMAEINRDVLRSIILDVLQEMGGVHEAPQFKASAGKSTTPSAAPRHEDPTGDDSWLQTGGPAQPGTSADEVVIAVGPAFGRSQRQTIVGVPASRGNSPISSWYRRRRFKSSCNSRIPFL